MNVNKPRHRRRQPDSRPPLIPLLVILISVVLVVACLGGLILSFGTGR